VDPHLNAFLNAGFNAKISDDGREKQITFTFRKKYKFLVAIKDDTISIILGGREAVSYTVSNVSETIQFLASALKEVASWPDTLEVDGVRFKMQFVTYTGKVDKNTLYAGFDFNDVLFWCVIVNQHHEEVNLQRDQMKSAVDVWTLEDVKHALHHMILEVRQ
jgi:hypothetical protein